MHSGEAANTSYIVLGWSEAWTITITTPMQLRQNHF